MVLGWIFKLKLLVLSNFTNQKKNTVNAFGPKMVHILWICSHKFTRFIMVETTCEETLLSSIYYIFRTPCKDYIEMTKNVVVFFGGQIMNL
jgi:hypothetical protein